MQIQHNLSAATANRNLNATQKQYQVSTQRLSSGYRINSSADDAAGLTISEKMRWQIRGMNRASDNVEDGISLTQVADGALQEVHAMLQRMVELTVQAANDSNTDEDREALQREINQIKTEINRISTDTEYNTIKIFKPTSVPKLSGNPTDLMVYWSDDTYPDGNRKGAGILYGGKRYGMCKTNGCTVIDLTYSAASLSFRKEKPFSSLHIRGILFHLNLSALLSARLLLPASYHVYRGRNTDSTKNYAGV